jgi:hypothetical protein
MGRIKKREKKKSKKFCSVEHLSRHLNHMGFQGIQSLRLGSVQVGLDDISSLWAFIIFPSFITLKAMGLSPESRLAELCFGDF